MNYDITIQRRALRALDRIARRDKDRIMERIERLSSDPRPQAATQLRGSDGWRLRVGDYRVVYTIDDAIRVVDVVQVGHRREVYRRL